MIQRIDDLSQYHFRGQHDDEKIISIIHRHWFDITVHYIFIAIIAIAALSSLFFVDLIERALNLSHTMLFMLLANSIIITILWLYGFLLWIDYWLDVWIVTDQRVVNIEQKGLFSRYVSELHFHTVQDITSKVQGIIPTILNYGDVEVQTAAENERFLFRRVPNPYAVKAMLLEYQRKAYQESMKR